MPNGKPSNKPDNPGPPITPPGLQKKIKEYKKFYVVVYIYAGGGYGDPANSTPLPSFELSVRILPASHFSEDDIVKTIQKIIDNGYAFKDELSEMRTYYPPNRISHIEVTPVED